MLNYSTSDDRNKKVTPPKVQTGVTGHLSTFNYTHYFLKVTHITIKF